MTRRPPIFVTGMGSSAPLGEAVARAGGFGLLRTDETQFPDGECYVRFHGKLEGRDLFVVNTLYPPNDGVMAALIAASAARDLGARRVVLAAPYLAYMRQDRRFHAGEAISSRSIARVLSDHFDGLITVDPHLHRYHSLDEIYSIPSRVLHADQAIADWIKARFKRPVLVGPDIESRQWVERVAELAQAPFVVMTKKRFSSTRVKSKGLDASLVRGQDAVVLDDIISSGHTMAGVIAQVKEAGARRAAAVGVHGLFAKGAVKLLRAAGASPVATCNTVPHPTNRIDLAPLLAGAISEFATS